MSETPAVASSVDDWAEPSFWERRLVQRAAWPVGKPQGSPCEECAVVDGFYAEISDGLARQPALVRAQSSAKWFCHMHPDRVCRGNIDHIKKALS